MNLLAPLGSIYGAVMDVRNRLYDRGLLRSFPLGARTISIGNLTAGGTGKTPIAALTARILAEGGETVCILTRGYGRENARERVLASDGESVLVDAAEGGDEPVELARKLLGRAVVIADADRVAAARWAVERFGITAFVLDDGFQHRRARRDLDIVCIDATNPCGNGRVLPAGTLREQMSGLRRADVIVVTRANLAASTNELVDRLRKLNSSAAIFHARTKIAGLTRLDDFAAGRSPSDAAFRPAAPLFLFTGIGNPGSLRTQLAAESFGIAGFEHFRDHHRYTQQDLDALERKASAVSAASLITTAKDAVKLDHLRTTIPIYVVESDIELDDPATFIRLIKGQNRER